MNSHPSPIVQHRRLGPKSWIFFLIIKLLLRLKFNFKQPDEGSFIYYVRKIFRKATISYLLIRTWTCACQGLRNVVFSGNFAYELNEWFLMNPYFLFVFIKYHLWLIIPILINSKLNLSELLLKKKRCSNIVRILQNVPPQMFGRVIYTPLRDSIQRILGIRN